MLNTLPQAPSQCSGASTIVALNPCKLLRQCDSRNLNLSPLCGLDSSSSPLKLQPTMEATYRSKGISPPYVEGLKSPMRKVYPDTMADNEILSTIAKVKISEEWIIAQSIISTSKPFSRIMNTTLTREMLLLWNQLCSSTGLPSDSAGTLDCFMISQEFIDWTIRYLGLIVGFLFVFSSCSIYQSK